MYRTWNGNVFQTRHVLEETKDLSAATSEHFKSAKKLLKAVWEFEQAMTDGARINPPGEAA